MIDSLGYGGAEQTLGRIVPRIDRAAFEVVVVVLQERDDNPVAAMLDRAGVRVDVVPVRRLRSLPDHLRLVRYLARLRPDVIHTHLEFSHSLGGVYGRLLGVPVVATVHTFAEAQSTRDQRRLPVMWWSLRRAHRLVIAPSAAGKSYFSDVGRIPMGKILVMHNGVDLDEFRQSSGAETRGDLGFGREDLMLTAVAVLRREKGLADLIAAVPQILEGVPSARVLIVGDGDDRRRLENLAYESGNGDRITFTGRRTDVDELLAASDVFIHPTHEDVLPTVIAEAMATGLPVVASRVGGIDEMVADGVTGVLYPAGDIDALGEAVLRVVSDEELRSSMAVAARKRAERLFDLGNQVRQLESLYTRYGS